MEGGTWPVGGAFMGAAPIDVKANDLKELGQD